MTREPLQEIKVVNFGWAGVANEIVKYLADYGAEVVQIESRSRPDVIRLHQPFKDNIPGINRSVPHAVTHRNKKGITLNMTNSRGVEVARRLVGWADVVIEAFTPGTMAKWNLDYEQIKTIRPDIIMLSTCNQGQTGPHAKHPGRGIQLTSQAGFVELNGWPDRDPAFITTAYTDITAPALGAAVLVAALDYRRRTGKGQYIDLSQYEAALQFLAPVVLDYDLNDRVANRMGNRSRYEAPHGAYPCRGEDRWCVITVSTEADWRNFCKAIGSPEWTTSGKFADILGRKANEDELDRLIGEWTATYSAEEVTAIMQSNGVTCAVVSTFEDVYQNQQFRHRQFFRELEHPEIGKHTHITQGFALSRTPCQLKTPAQRLGEHNEFVYTKFLGMSEEEFVELRSAGVFD